MSLEKDEKELKEKIESQNLERKIRHIRFDEPTSVTIDGRTYSETEAVTVVMLIEDDGNNDRVLEKFYDVDGQNVGVLTLDIWRNKMKGLGIAVCSADDQFHRQRGRVIGTGRAWKDMKENSIFH